MPQWTRSASRLTPLGIEIALPGPVGEHNLYALHPRGRILLLPCTRTGLIEQVMAALADGNDMVIRDDILFRESLGTLPPMVAARLRWTTDWETQGPYAAALIEDAGEARLKALAAIARLPGCPVRSCWPKQTTIGQNGWWRKSRPRSTRPPQGAMPPSWPSPEKA